MEKSKNAITKDMVKKPGPNIIVHSRPLIVVRAPIAYEKNEDKESSTRSLDECLIALENEFCFLVIEEERTDIQFEYPKNYSINK